MMGCLQARLHARAAPHGAPVLAQHGSGCLALGLLDDVNLLHLRAHASVIWGGKGRVCAHTHAGAAPALCWCTCAWPAGLCPPPPPASVHTQPQCNVLWVWQLSEDPEHKCPQEGKARVGALMSGSLSLHARQPKSPCQAALVRASVYSSPCQCPHVRQHVSELTRQAARVRAHMSGSLGSWKAVGQGPTSRAQQTRSQAVWATSRAQQHTQSGSLGHELNPSAPHPQLQHEQSGSQGAGHSLVLKECVVPHSKHGALWAPGTGVKIEMSDAPRRAPHARMVQVHDHMVQLPQADGAPKQTPHPRPDKTCRAPALPMTHLDQRR